MSEERAVRLTRGEVSCKKISKLAQYLLHKILHIPIYVQNWNVIELAFRSR